MKFLRYSTTCLITVCFIIIAIYTSNSQSTTSSSSPIIFNATIPKSVINNPDSRLLIPMDSIDEFTPEIYLYYKMNKNKCIGNFIPPSLIEIDRNYTRGSLIVSSLIVDDLELMIRDAYADGVELKVVSGYRSYFDQKMLFESYVANELKSHPSISRSDAERLANVYSAYPGCSEHQLGTAVDILSMESGYTFNVDNSMKFIQWINNNSTKYNFYMSYPEGNPEYKYEPWHLRWIPR